MPATILDYVKPMMQIYDEEIFGPQTTVVRVRANSLASLRCVTSDGQRANCV